MKTLTQDLTRALRDAPLPIRPQAVAGTCRLAAAQLRQKAAGERISFASFLLVQARFAAPRIALVQTGALLLLAASLRAALGPVYWAHPRYPAMLLCCACALVWLSLPLFLSRAHRHRMLELEAASRFPWLIASRLLLAGMSGSMLLGGVLLFVLLRSPMPLGSALLYLLLPSPLFGAVCLALLVRLPAERWGAGGLCACALALIGLPLLYRLRPALFQQALTPALAALCAALTLLCAGEARVLLSRASRGAPQCA